MKSEKKDLMYKKNIVFRSKANLLVFESVCFYCAIFLYKRTDKPRDFLPLIKNIHFVLRLSQFFFIIINKEGVRLG